MGSQQMGGRIHLGDHVEGQLSEVAIMGRLQGKTALVTGGAGGIGAATVSAFQREGATVIAADLPVALSDSSADAHVELDVSDEVQWRSVVSAITKTHGSLDVLVNAAGIEGDVITGTPETTSLAEWRRVMAVNLDGTFLGCREVLPGMRAAGHGSIVNLSSVVAYFPTLTSTAYGASKGAVTQLTKSVALFGCLEGKRIRCNSVHPGTIATRMLDSIFEQMAQRNGVTVEEARRAPFERIPFGAPGVPGDVADLILFLASDEAKYITGAEFVVDGGWKLGGPGRVSSHIATD